MEVIYAHSSGNDKGFCNRGSFIWNELHADRKKEAASWSRALISRIYSERRLGEYLLQSFFVKKKLRQREAKEDNKLVITTGVKVRASITAWDSIFPLNIRFKGKSLFISFQNFHFFKVASECYSLSVPRLMSECVKQERHTSLTKDVTLLNPGNKTEERPTMNALLLVGKVTSLLFVF